MSLARAFTKRSKRTGDIPEPLPGRALSSRKPSVNGINRSLISSPVELISTTNMLSYNAPDLPNPTLRHIPSSSATSLASKKSSEESDGTMSSPDLTDASSIDSGSPTSPKPNHLSSYFAATGGKDSVSAKGLRPHKSVSTSSLHMKANSNPISPALPQRAVAHSKQAHEQLARQRSMRSMNSRSSSGSNELRSSREHRSSADMFRVEEEPTHPFGKELEQLKEVVEEFGGVIAEAEMDEDIIFMRDNGLAKWSAGDYLMEIQPLFGRVYDMGLDQRLPAVNEVPAWI